MLRYDHSKHILEGLLGRHFLYDVNSTDPIRDSEGNYKYGKTMVDFPQPQYGGSSEVTFAVDDDKGDPKPYRAIVSLYTAKQKPLKNRETYVVYWGDFPFVCKSYLSRTDQANDKRTDDDTIKNYYLGNPTILEVEGAKLDLPIDPQELIIEEYDENMPFFIWLEGAKQKIHIYKKDWDPAVVSFGFYKRPEPEIYIGLFTAAPDYNGENGKEPGREVGLYDSDGEPIIDEITGQQKKEYQLWPEYLRVKLNTLSRFDKVTPLLGSAAIVDGHPQVHNQDMILFPEAVGDPQTETGWGKVTHFGLFYGQKDNPDQQVPFLWGEITGEDGGVGVDIGFYEVPVIRKEGLKILLE